MAKPSYLPAEVTTYWDPDEGRVVQPAGRVLQVKQTVFKSTWDGGGDGTVWYHVPGLDCTITPESTSSKVLIRVSANIGSGYWEIQGRFTKGGSVITESLGDTRGSRSRCSFVDNRYEAASNQRNGWGVVTAEFLDSPATTSATTYGIDLNGYSTSTVGVNYNPYSDADVSADYFGRPISTLTLMEISG
jgi:hypothetical protein